MTALLEINSTTSIAPILTLLPLPASLARWAKVSLDLEFEKALVLLPQKSSALGRHNGAKHFMKQHLIFHTYGYLGRPIGSSFGICKVGTTGSSPTTKFPLMQIQLTWESREICVS